jgi:hypothetical protein
MIDSRCASGCAVAVLFVVTAAQAQTEPNNAASDAGAAPAVLPSAAPPAQLAQTSAPSPASVPSPAPAPSGEPAAPAPSPAPPWVGSPPSPGLLPELAIGQFRTRVYGFGEVDFIHDSTQAFGDLGAQLSTAIPKNYDYAGSRGKFVATARNSRLGVLVAAPDFAGIRTRFTFEGDFMGNQPSDAAESAAITSGLFRLRVAALQLDNDYVNVLVGQAWGLFALQPFFSPASDYLLPIPGQIQKRDVQLQLTHTFHTDAIDVELGASVNRPPQSAAEVPEGQAVARFSLNGWRGIHTPGTDGQRIVGASRDALSIAFSASGRRFRVSDFEPTPAANSPNPRYSNEAGGYGLALDALIPIIPAPSAANRANALTLTAEATTGTGYADLLGGLVSNGGGVNAPASNYPMVPGSPDPYVPNIDPGLVTYDNAGNLHTIDWTTFVVGAQYYLPFASGRFFLSANYAEARSDNVSRWGDPGQIPFIFTKTQYADGNLFWDVSLAVRVVLSYQYYIQTFADGETAHNERTEMSWFLWF